MSPSVNKKNIALMIIGSVILAVALLVGALCAYWCFLFIIAFGGVYTTAWLVAICVVLIAVGGVALIIRWVACALSGKRD